jgi:hypothetical protein
VVLEGLDRRARGGPEGARCVTVGQVPERGQPLLDVEDRVALGTLGERQGRQVAAYR